MIPQYFKSHHSSVPSAPAFDDGPFPIRPQVRPITAGPAPLAPGRSGGLISGGRKKKGGGLPTYPLRITGEISFRCMNEYLCGPAELCG
jgi:hypothetical protein